MKKRTSVYYLSLLLLISFTTTAQSFYDYTVLDIDSNRFSMSQLEGKKVMVVNVASKCGLTPQYKQLEAIYRKYKDDNFIIIGFPSNDFMKQEPGSNEDIKVFCSEKYDVTFPIMSKIIVKGDEMEPIYQWLTQKELNGFEDSSVKWNFQKYLIGEEGNIEKIISPRIKPDNDKIINWIEDKETP